MPLPVIQPGEADAMRSAVASASSELDAILRRTCSLLAAMTRLPAVATPPDADDTELRQVFVSPVGVDKALLVLLFSTGRTENRLVGVRLTASDALLLANALNEWLGGQTLSALRQLPPDGDAAGAATAPPELRHLAAAWNRLAGEAVAAARAVGDDLPMVVEGAHAVLEHPEFRDVERLGQFLTTLQERAAVLEMMGRALEERRQIGKSSSVQVVIGEEIGRPAASGVFRGFVHLLRGRPRARPHRRARADPHGLRPRRRRGRVDGARGGRPAHPSQRGTLAPLGPPPRRPFRVPAGAPIVRLPEPDQRFQEQHRFHADRGNPKQRRRFGRSRGGGGRRDTPRHHRPDAGR
jgi:hypothetical protein